MRLKRNAAGGSRFEIERIQAKKKTQATTPNNKFQRKKMNEEIAWQ